MPKTKARPGNVGICVQRGWKTMLDLTPLERAIAQLEEALELCEAGFESHDPRLKRHLRAASIQAFEFTYDLSFKMMKHHLAVCSPNPTEIDLVTFDEVVREAFRRGLVKSELREWRTYRDRCGETINTYDEEMAQQVFSAIPGFLPEARFLRDELRRRNNSGADSD